MDMEVESSGRVLLSVEEAARQCGVSRAHLYKPVMRGELPSVRIGRSRRVLISDLVEWISRLKEEQVET